MANTKKWNLLPSAPDGILKELHEDKIISQILYNRGHRNGKDVTTFLNPDIYQAPLDFDSLSLDEDMKKAVDRIIKAIYYNERIAVYGDFDADGITSTALMLRVFGFLRANVMRYIPDREKEGYGVNKEAITYLGNMGAKIIFTVDCGIRSVDEAEYAKSKGLCMIITDHHELGDKIPDAYAVIDPQKGKHSVYKEIAGVGVAYAFSIALLKRLWEISGQSLATKNAYNGFLRSLLYLVAIGNTADIMPLSNPIVRSWVVQGVNQMKSFTPMGIRELLDVSGKKPEDLTAKDIGFVIGPRLNVAGRLEHAYLAVDLLNANSPEEAYGLAKQLQNLNQKRQDMTSKVLERVQNNLTDSDDKIIIIQDNDVHAGIVGLVAGKLTEKYYKPSIVIETSDKISKASCRSIEEFHITNALNKLSKMLVKHGGHAMAAGFSIDNSKVNAFQKAITAIANAELSNKELVPKIDIDAEVDLKDLTPEFVKNLDILEPTGHGNEQAVFIARGLQVVEWRSMGSSGSHLRMSVRQKGVMPMKAVAFSVKERIEDDAPQKIDAIFNVEIDTWGGEGKVQLILLDFHVAE